MFDLNDYVEKHPEREIEGIVKRNGYDEWGVYDERFERLFLFEKDIEFELQTNNGWETCKFVSDKNSWWEGKYKVGRKTFQFEEEKNYVVKMKRNIKSQLYDYVMEYAVDPEVFADVLRKLEELGFSVFDCAFVSADFTENADYIDVEGANFFVFENDNKRCNVQHIFRYDNKYDKNAAKWEEFIFTLNSGRTYKVTYATENQHYENLGDDPDFFEFNKEHIISEPLWNFEYPENNPEEKEYIYTFSENPTRGTLNTLTDFILLSTDRGSIGHSVVEASKTIIQIRDDIHAHKFRNNDYEQIEIRGIRHNHKEKNIWIWVDYLVDEHLRKSSYSSYDIKRAFEHHALTNRYLFNGVQLIVDIKRYENVTVDPCDDSFSTEEHYYERVLEAFAEKRS